jgi:hypothetical protein
MTTNKNNIDTIVFTDDVNNELKILFYKLGLNPNHTELTNQTIILYGEGFLEGAVFNFECVKIWFPMVVYFVMVNHL